MNKKTLVFLLEIFPGYSEDILKSIYYHTKSLDKTVNKLLEMSEGQFILNPSNPTNPVNPVNPVNKIERQNIIMTIRSKLRSFKRKKKYQLLEFDDLSTLE